jgi:hypothetical protein
MHNKTYFLNGMSADAMKRKKQRHNKHFLSAYKNKKITGKGSFIFSYFFLDQKCHCHQ